MIINNKEEYEVKEVQKYREEGRNTWYIGKIMEINTINRLQKWDCLMQKR